MKNTTTSIYTSKSKIENMKWWLKQGQINWIINWNAGLDCFGDKITDYKYSK